MAPPATRRAWSALAPPASGAGLDLGPIKRLVRSVQVTEGAQAGRDLPVRVDMAAVAGAGRAGRLGQPFLMQHAEGPQPALVGRGQVGALTRVAGQVVQLLAAVRRPDVLVPVLLEGAQLPVVGGGVEVAEAG